MEYLTDTLLCKALFVFAFMVGIIVGLLIKGRG